MALLEPAALKDPEKAGDLTTRLALMEELKTMPWGAVWDQYCETQNITASIGSGTYTFTGIYEDR